MNIIQKQDRLKGMSQDAIVNYIQNPTGDIPTFLALAELERRKDMQNKYEAATSAQKPSIAEQIVSENMGIGSITPSKAMDPSTAMDKDAGINTNMIKQSPSLASQPSSVLAAGSGIANLPIPEPSFAGGGIIAFEEGGLALDPDELTVPKNPYDPLFPSIANLRPVEIPQSLSFDEFTEGRRQREKAYGVDPDIYRTQAEELRAEREALKADRDKAANMALLKSGLGIMGGTSQFALENIAKGAMPGIEGFERDVKDIKQQENLLNQSVRQMQMAEQAQKRGDIAAFETADEKRQALQAKYVEMDLNYAYQMANALSKGKDTNSKLMGEAMKVALEEMKTIYPNIEMQFADNPEAFRLELNELTQQKYDNMISGKVTNDPVKMKATDYGSEEGKRITDGKAPKYPTVKNKDQYDALMPGELYLDPDGNLRTKPRA